ncbi:alpha/beta hydrolase [Legionella israelensis]
MMLTTITEARNFLHAQLCYQLFITPLHLPVEKQYRHFASRACEYFEDKRSEAIHQQYPRHHIIHHFAQAHRPQAKKILIAHGWMSRAAYMIRLTHTLHQQGYDVYIPDFPAHGEAKGFQLPWTDAVLILKNIINQFGPFYAVIGHSFGGSMLLNTLNLAGQLPDWQLKYTPERFILIASPTRMRSPVHRLARRFKLNGAGFQCLRDVIYQQADIDPRLVRLQNFLVQGRTIPFLCIHGEKDLTVHPKESIIFCRNYHHGELKMLKDATHVSVLLDERVEQHASEFLNRKF